MKVLNPSLGIQQRDWESPGNLALRVSGIWSQAFQRTEGTRDSSLGGHKQNFVCIKTQRRGAVTTRRLNQYYLLMLEGLLWRERLAGAHHRNRVTRRSPSAWSLLEFTINPTIELADPRAGSPQAKQLPGGHQPRPSADNWIKALLSKTLSLEQHPVFPITSPSHQEAYTSL